MYERGTPVVPIPALQSIGHRKRARLSYRGTSLIRNTPLLGPYSKTIPRVLRWP